MELFTGQRGSGKTRALIKKAHENNFGIVVYTSRHIKHLTEICHYLRKPVPVFSISEVLEGKHKGYSIEGLYYDEIELILDKISGLKTKGISGTLDIKAPKEKWWVW